MMMIANVLSRFQTVKDVIKPLSKNWNFRTSFDSQQVKGSQALVKYTREHFYNIFWSFWGEKNHKKSPLLKFEVLGVFVNTLTADENYPFGNSGICSSLFKCNSLKNEKLFHNSLFYLWNIHKILNIFKEKMIVIANVFLKLQKCNYLKNEKHFPNFLFHWWNLHQILNIFG